MTFLAGTVPTVTCCGAMSAGLRYARWAQKKQQREMRQPQEKGLPAGGRKLMHVLSLDQAGRFSLELGHQAFRQVD